MCTMLNRMLVNYDDSNISGRGALKLVGYIPFNPGFTKPGSKDLGMLPMIGQLFYS